MRTVRGRSIDFQSIQGLEVLRRICEREKLEPNTVDYKGLRREEASQDKHMGFRDRVMRYAKNTFAGFLAATLLFSSPLANKANQRVNLERQDINYTQADIQGSNNGTIAIGEYWDRQNVEAFTSGAYLRLSYNIVARTEPSSYDTAYLVNGISSATGNWYQVGFDYWNGIPGMTYEIWNNKGQSIDPKNGGSYWIPMNNVSPGDTINVTLTHQIRVDNKSYSLFADMSVEDMNTGDAIFEDVPILKRALNAPFKGDLFVSVKKGVNNNGYLTGLMQEEHYTSFNVQALNKVPFYNSADGTTPTSAQFRSEEFLVLLFNDPSSPGGIKQVTQQCCIYYMQSSNVILSQGQSLQPIGNSYVNTNDSGNIALANQSTFFAGFS